MWSIARADSLSWLIDARDYVCMTFGFKGVFNPLVTGLYRGYRFSSYVKVIGSRSRSQEAKRSKIPIPAM